MKKVQPLVMVAAEGGGIRAAWWTIDVMSKVASTECGANSVLLASGVSGGAVGLGVMAATGDGQSQQASLAAVERMAAQDALAASRDGERYFFELALYHEDMHGEALLMTLQTLALPPPPGLREPPRVPASRSAGVDLAFPGGTLVAGSRESDARDRFVFDNEMRAHDVRVAPFAIAGSCVTEGEFAAFVDDGGYGRAELWTDEGWRWLASAGRCWRPVVSWRAWVSASTVLPLPGSPTTKPARPWPASASCSQPSR